MNNEIDAIALQSTRKLCTDVAETDKSDSDDASPFQLIDCVIASLSPTFTLPTISNQSHQATRRSVNGYGWI